MNTEVVYITGLAHSGSTLLDMLLGSHPLFLSTGEMKKFDEWVKFNKRCTCGEPVHCCKLWRPVLSSFHEPGILMEQLPEQFPTTIDPHRDVRVSKVERLLFILTLTMLPFSLVQKVVRRLAPQLYMRGRNIHQLYGVVRREGGGVRALVDSSKSFMRMSVLFTLRPKNTKVVFLTRDGRGTLLSVMNRSSMLALDYTKIWRRTYHRILHCLQQLPPGAFLQVQYESICREPAATLEHICDFLGYKFEPGMLEFRDHERHNLGGNRMRWGKERKIREDLRWRDQLSGKDLRTFENIAGALNRRLLGDNYEP